MVLAVVEVNDTLRTRGVNHRFYGELLFDAGPEACRIKIMLYANCYPPRVESKTGCTGARNNTLPRTYTGTKERESNANHTKGDQTEFYHG